VRLALTYLMAGSFHAGMITMMYRRRFDIGEIAGKASDAERRVSAIVVVGDQEKYAEIVVDLASTVLEIGNAGHHPG
jgi:hypothetical protein